MRDSKTSSAAHKTATGSQLEGGGETGGLERVRTLHSELTQMEYKYLQTTTPLKDQLIAAAITTIKTPHVSRFGAVLEDKPPFRASVWPTRDIDH